MSDTLSSGDVAGPVLTRREFAATAAALLAAPGVLQAQAPATTAPSTAPVPPPEPFGFEDVVRAAAEVAGRDHVPPAMTLRAPFADLNYDQYRAMSMREDRRLWQGEDRGFTADLMPPGFFFRDGVQIAVVEGGVVREIPFDAAAIRFDAHQFDLPDGPPEGASDGHAWTGFRLRHAINRPEFLDEFLVFQGASYFRAIGRGLLYGLSARGLAIGTAAARGEEFPGFTRFWLHAPEPHATSITVHALLDSPSVAGAFEFTVRPGLETVMDVRSALIPRVTVEDAGIAPLTSMHWFSALRRGGVDDHRASVHDSDGLAMLNGRGERIWRPLANPGTLQWSAFADENPRGFGLAKRAREFRDYLDTEARYELRPSAWVEPRGDWGRGSVILVEIPTRNEFNDNIVAFWRPEAPLEAGVERRFDYRLVWSARPPQEASLAQVTASRAGRAVNDEARRTFVIDLDLVGRGLEGLTVEAEAGRGVIEDVRLMPLPAPGHARIGLEFTPPEGGEAAELRVRLVGADGAAASETWLYRWSAAQ